MTRSNSPNRELPALFREGVVISLITLNTLVLFLDEFPEIHRLTRGYLFWVDYACIIFFILEALMKIRCSGFPDYWGNLWNRFDFVVVLSSMPTLMMPFLTGSEEDLRAFSIVLVLRMGRLLRFFRLLRFIPHAERILGGVIRALKASVGVLVILFILNLAFAMVATILFAKTAPEYFGNPLISLYSLFKVFTIEGWFEIPDTLARRDIDPGMIFLLRAFFVVAVTVGGLLGLSMANAVFVDEMTMDNTDVIESKIDRLQQELTELKQLLAQGRK